MGTNLVEYRNELNAIDLQLVELLAKRFQVTKIIGIYKKQHNLRPVDLDREKVQFKRIEMLAIKNDLDPYFAKLMLRLIIDEVVKNHIKLRQGKNNA